MYATTSFSIEWHYSYLKSCIDRKDISGFAMEVKEIFGGREEFIQIYQYDSHEMFIDALRVINQYDELLTCFERMYKEGRWDCDDPWIIYDDPDLRYDPVWMKELLEFYGGSEERGPSASARSAYYVVQRVKKMIAQASKDVFVYNEKWIVWTRAADDPDAYLQEAIEDGSVLVCGPDESEPTTAVNRRGLDNILYVSGWDSFTSLFSLGMYDDNEFGKMIRLTDVHQRVADLLLAVQTKNQEDGQNCYYVRVKWINRSTCVKVGGMDTDAFRPKKRVKLERKCMRIFRR